MKKSAFLIIWFAGLAVTFCACATIRSQPDFRQLYGRYEKAVHDMDSTAYMAMFTDDFSMSSPDGKVHDLAEMTKYQKVNAETTKKVNSYSVVIESITPIENGEYAVIVLQKYDRDQAPLEQPNQPHNIKTSVIQRETWHRDRDVWKIRRIQELLVGPSYFDGKIME